MAASREKLVKQAEKLVGRGRVEAAIKQYRKVLKDNPQDINVLNRVGDLYARIQKYEDAVKLFTQIAEQYTDEGFFVKAIAIYKKIIKLDPTQLEVYERLAELYHRQGLINEARTQYQVLADYHTKHENPASAISIYQRMTTLEPEDPAHHAKLAELYLQRSLTDKAMVEFRTIADIMLDHGHGNDAVQVLERALDVDSSDLGFIEEYLGKLRAEGEVAGAARFLAQAIERNPAAEALLDLSSEQEAVKEEAEAPPPPAEGLAAEAPPEPAPARDLISLDDTEEEDEVPAAGLAVEDTAAPATEDTGPAEAVELSEELALEWDRGTDAESQVAPPPDMEGPGSGFTRTSAQVQAEGAAGSVSFDSEEVDLSVLELEDLSDESELEATGGDLDDLQSLGDPEDIELDIDLLDDLDDLELTSEGQAVSEPASAAPPAAAVAPEDLFSEAEVLAKYGLLEKSSERLQELLEAHPQDAPGHRLLIQIHLELGEEELAQGLGESLARLAAGSESAAHEWSRAREALVAAGLVVIEEEPPPVVEESPAEEPPAEELPAEELPAEEPAAAEVPTELEQPEDAIEEEIAVEAGDEVEADLDLEAEADESAELTELGDDSLDMLAPLEDDTFGDDLPEIELPDDLVVEEPAAVELPAEPEPEPGDEEETPELAAAAAPVEAQDEAPPSTPLSKEQKARIDRFLDNLLEDAHTPGQRRKKTAKAVERLLDSGPARIDQEGEPATPASGALATLDELTRQYRRPEKAAAQETPPAQEPPATPPAGEPEEELLDELAPMDEVAAAEAAVPAIDPDDHTDIEDAVAGLGPATTSEPAPEPAAAEETDSRLMEVDDTGVSWLDDVAAGEDRDQDAEEAFEDEEGFFDLAAELEEELSVSEATGLAEPAGEQTLDQIVQGFKKGVAEVLPEDDYATHLDLGIAYQEMGLVDEAIGEFQQAAKAPELLVQSCSLLGLCFRDKGLPDLAVKWYTRGLASPELSEEDGLALLYELGDVYLSLGDEDNARKTFVEVYGVNSHYRDVSAKLKELGAEP